MDNYVFLSEHESSISVYFSIESEKPFKIGEKMNELHEEAYMNGYNWEAFFNYYLAKHHPQIMIEMGSDPEAGSYVAYYKLSDSNKQKAEKLVTIIQKLVDNEDELYRIVKEERDNIEWD